MTYPLSVNDDGLKIKPELMENEKLYHCIFKDKALLVFKDSQDFLNCFEIEEASLVDKIRDCKHDSDLEKLFEDYLSSIDPKN